VGFTSQASFDDLVADRHLPAGTDAVTATPAYGCGITEAHIMFPDPNASHWTFFTPFTASWYAAGARYYDAGAEIPTGGFPWANRPAADSVRPLPDDARVLRARYPASGTRYDVAVLNTWYEQPAD